MSSSSPSTASPTAAPVSRARRRATWSSCAARCRATGVRARIGKSKRSWAEAELVELLEPSPDRIEPEAPHPGAPWQVLPYERQLEEKEAQVREALERIGGFDDPPVEPIVPAVEQLRYRNKLEYSFGNGRGRRARARLPPRRPLGPDRRRGGRHPRLRAHQRGARGGQGLVPRGGPRRVGPRRPARPPAQPRGARGPPHRVRSRRASSRAPAPTSASTSSPPPRRRTRSCGRAPRASPRPLAAATPRP